MIKIGITERGDASIDYSWVDKLNEVDGAILITKNVTNEFIEKVLPYKEKVILHATITGYGGTTLEPNVMKSCESFIQIEKLICAGFDKSHIVVRVDPVIPTFKGINNMINTIYDGYNIGLKRFRVSIIDMYPHVRERFISAGIIPPVKNFSADQQQIEDVNDALIQIKKSLEYITIEACAEPSLTAADRIGCISNRDAAILNLGELPDASVNRQRHDCLCSSCKTELLSSKHRCPNNCLYCYWQD